MHRWVFQITLFSMKLSNVINKKSYEQIVRTVRRHPITFVPTILAFIALAFVPIIVWWLINNAFSVIAGNQTIYIIAVLFGSAYYLSLCLFFYSYFTAFYLDIWIITNDRFIDIRQISLFARSVAETDLYQIQDVTSEVIGFFATIFQHGNVTIQTAGAVPKFIIHDAHRPDELRKLILDLAAEDKKFHNTPPPTTNN